MEALFLEGAGRLVGAAPASLLGSQPASSTAADLEGVAFEWLLCGDTYLAFPDPYRHKDRVGDGRGERVEVVWGPGGGGGGGPPLQTPPPPPLSRPQVVLAAAELLGALSPLRLASITQRWLAELNRLIRADNNSPARQQLFDLCAGLRCVRLCGDNDAQLAASTELLRLAHPLTHVAPDKKSRVQQAICDMLACMLAPLADEGDPRWGWGWEWEGDWMAVPVDAMGWVSDLGGMGHLEGVAR